MDLLKNLFFGQGFHRINLLKMENPYYFVNIGFISYIVQIEENAIMDCVCKLKLKQLLNTELYIILPIYTSIGKNWF